MSVQLKDKEVYELNAQREWIGYDFRRLRDVLYEYWHDYRFWNDIKQTVPFHAARNFLDVGCGVVSVLNVVKRDFPHLELLGADPLMDRYLELYEIDRTILWRSLYMENLELPPASYDVVCCSNALDHVENVEMSLQELRTVVAQKGTLILTLDVFAAPFARNEGHPYTFTKESLENLLQQSGFRIVWSRLSRRKIGVMKYADLRIRRHMSRSAIFARIALREQFRSCAKQLLRRGALGELMIVAKIA